MKVAFVHTPMSSVNTAGRHNYWRNFDIRYHAVHPNLRPMEKFLWELPHWITWLAGVLEHEGSYSLEALDLYTDYGTHDGIDELGIINTINKHPADVFLFSPMTPNLHHAVKISEIVKEKYPTALTIFGGVAATPLHKELAAHPVIDYVIRGKGEYALPELLRAIEHSLDLESIGNLTYQSSNGQVRTTSFTYPMMPLEELPFPKIDIFPRETGKNLRYIRHVHASGCPYKCPFCSDLNIGVKPAYFGFERVLAEIKAYREQYGQHHHVYFGDENFTLNPERTLAFCNFLRNEGPIEYDCQTRLNCLQDPRLPDSLYASGCRWIEIGLETTNQESQNLYKQNTKEADLEETLLRLRESGIAACTNLVIGFPNETRDDMKKTIDRICSLITTGVLHASNIFQLVPYPGSRIYDAPREFGLKIHHHDYALYNEELLPVFDTPHATAEEIHKIFLYGVREIGNALSSKPYLGDVKRANDLDFGNFWQDV